MHTAPGFDTRNVITFKNAFSNEQAASSATLSQRLDELTARLEAIPGVASAAAVSNLPTQLVADLSFDIIGRGKDRKDAGGDEKYIAITAHYFDACAFPWWPAGHSPSRTATPPRRL